MHDPVQRIPVAREELEVEKRQVETGRVHVRKVVHEHDELVDESLLRDEIEVERVAVNRVVDEPAEIRREGDVLVIPVLEEVLVVQRQLVLKEELRVRRHAVDAPHRQRVVLRSEEVIVEHSKSGTKGVE
jgi:uncharacterized protein (TIGR02271 family)